MVAVTVKPETDRESNQGGAEAARSYDKADTDQRQCRYTMQVPWRVGQPIQTVESAARRTGPVCRSLG